MIYQCFTVSVVGRVQVITITRPHAANALHAQAATELSIILDRAEATDEIDALVLTGSGSIFCAGADLRCLAMGERALARGKERDRFAGFVRRRLRMPVVAALNGGALGGGVELLLACDASLATASAYLCLPELQHGLLPAGGGLIRLTRALPPHVASEFLLTGRQMSAHEAKTWGLVNEIVDAFDLQAASIDLARRLTTGRSEAIAATLRLLRQVQHEDSPWGLVDREFESLRRSGDTERIVREFLKRSRNAATHEKN